MGTLRQCCNVYHRHYDSVVMSMHRHYNSVVMSMHRHYDSFSLRIERVGGSKFPVRSLQAILPLRRIKKKNFKKCEYFRNWSVVMSMCRNVYCLCRKIVVMSMFCCNVYADFVTLYFLNYSHHKKCIHFIFIEQINL